MLPSKIRLFVSALIRKTEAGEMSWVYDDDNSNVFVSSPEYQVTVQYSFNMNEEVGQFVIFYHDKNENKEYRFSTDERSDDYWDVKRLYEVAQASGLNLPF